MKSATTQSLQKTRIGVIGCGGIAGFHAWLNSKNVSLVAMCDVDRGHAGEYFKNHGQAKTYLTDDYHDVLADKNIEAVWVCTPDHWHTKIAIDAMRAGKDVYLEKPATLTIDEGKLLCKVTRETKRIVQVGTQQRNDEHFLTAVGLVHAGRLGKIKNVTVVLGDTPRGKGFATTDPPKEINWVRWLGQTPKVGYSPQRCHDFRWWYEYSGGLMTDWGAHHVDIAQWAVAASETGPVRVEPLYAVQPEPMLRGMPALDNGFNTAVIYDVACTYANGITIHIRDRVKDFPSNNGVLIEGDRGTIFVNRDKVTGNVVDELKNDPLPKNLDLPDLDKSIEQPHQRHMAEFLKFRKTRTKPRSDVWSHYQMLVTCHLSNIALRLGRAIQWDQKREQIVGDEEANSFLKRPQRAGYEVV